mmetsp:Transcript_12520/g.18765  ORF Transcript_12520/g.18765 Transcript_12520/m.18765 type:complete len:124 (-) Transcript_12520:1782-2153(-)
MFVSGLLQTPEVFIYQQLVMSLSVTEKDLTKIDGITSFAAIVKAIQYVLVRIDKLLEEKQVWNEEKSKLENEILELCSQLGSIGIEVSVSNTKEQSPKFVEPKTQEDSNKEFELKGNVLKLKI